MKLGRMQPYFIPYLGYFSLIEATDRWIFFDTPQYIRHGWVNRNQILKPSKDDRQYITVPLEKHPHNILIKDVRIKQNGWQEKMLAQLDHYKNKARYFKEINSLLKDCLFAKKTQANLVQLNVKLVRSICEYCSIELNCDIFSEMLLSILQVDAPDEWALKISKALGAKTYINPVGGIKFFNISKYQEAGIDLQFLENHLEPYAQPTNDFIGGLSIIDALMFHSPEEVREMIKSYTYK